MDYVASARPGLAPRRTPLTDFLMSDGRTTKVATEIVRWKLRGTGEVQAHVLENLVPGNLTPGVGGTLFDIKLDVQWWVPGDIIAPNTLKELQVIIKHAEPAPDGVGYIYTVQITNNRRYPFFPPELLKPTVRWIKIGNAVGEASYRHGSFVVGGMSYIEFQSTMSDYSKKVDVSNKAHKLNIRMQRVDHTGAPMPDYPDKIISKIEAEFLTQVKWEKELMLFYGAGATGEIVDDSSGYEIRFGPGLIEFMKDGNVIDYPVRGGSLKMFEEFLQGVWVDRIDPENRNVVAFTGQGGLSLWRDWVGHGLQTSNIPLDFNTYVKDGPSMDPKNSRGLTYPAAYPTATTFYPFGSMQVKHWPILDSYHLNGDTLHPDTGLPLSSYEFIILDFGYGMGGGSNIELLESVEEDVWTYICGTHSPLGPINSGTGRGGYTASHEGRFYTLVHEQIFGLRVKDVSLTAYFRPSVQAF